MMDNENQNQPNQKISFESLDILIGKWRDGTFSEIIDDWKWIFSYSKRYKGAIAFYTILGIFSTSMGLVGSVASKYMIDIITGYQMSKLWIMVLITLGSAFFSLTIGNVIGRISTKLSIYINNDIQADIFDKIIDADWMEINQYSNGDVLNRFNSDVNTISGNAISNYTLRITPKTSGSRYDVVYAYSGEALALKNCRRDSGNITNSTYFKANKTGICKCTIYAFDVEVPYFQAERIWEESAGNE